MKYKMIGFDLDGTLVNSLGAIAYGVNSALRKYNLKEYEVNEYMNLVGGGLDKLTQRIIEKEKYDIDVDILSKEVKEECSKYFLKDLKLFKNIDILLSYLVENNVKIVVITNKVQNIATMNEKTILKDWSFIEFIGASDKYPLKPNPNSILDILKKYRIDKKQFLFIGDMLVDYETSKNADIDFIYCNWGFGNMKKEKLSNDIIKVDDPLEIIEYIND